MEVLDFVFGFTVKAKILYVEKTLKTSSALGRSYKPE
jgi:hypothetical protein